MIEPNIANDSTFNEPNNPLTQTAVEDKAYGHKQVEFGNEKKLYEPIPEAKFEPPKINFGNTGTNSTSQNPNKEPEVLSPAQESAMAKESARAMISFYEDAHILAENFALTNLDKINKLHNEGEIDANEELNVSANKKVTVMQYLQQSNNEIKEILTVDDDFKKAATPPLERIIKKNKWYVSDEMILTEIVIKDVAIKTGVIIGIKKSISMLIEQLKENRKSNAPPENLTTQQASTNSSSSNSSSSQESSSNEDNFARPDVIIDTKKKRKYTKRSKDESKETIVRDLDESLGF